MTSWIQDLRFALRLFVRRPAFSAVGILTLALGICATTTIFSVVEAVLLHPLPYESADELYLVRNRDAADGRLSAAAWREVGAWKEAAEGEGGYQGLVAFVDRPYNVTGIDEPVQVWAAQVSDGFFDLVGVEAVRGRTLSAEEQTAGGPRAVLVSHGFWQRWLGGDPEVVGSTLELDEESHEVVGVLPPGFRSPTDPVELWLSVEPVRDQLPQDLGLKFFSVLARLPPGMSAAEGEQRLAPVAQRIAAEHPRSNAGLAPTLIPLREQMLGDVRPALLMLLAAGGLVLAIACLNVANLLLVRANGRRREFAVRSALGVSAGRLFRQLVTESAVFALAGGGLGLLLTLFTLRALPSVLPAGVLPPTSELALDGLVLGFTTLLVALISVGFGLAPLARAGRRTALVDDAPRSSGGGGGKVSRRLRNGLVVGEVALALVLLVCASLLITSLGRLRSVDLGFEPRGVLSLYMLIPESRYPDPPDRQRFLADLIDRLERLPGVDSAAMVTHLPLGNNDISEEVEIDGRPPASGEVHRASYRGLYGDYFETLGIPLVRGRLLDRSDHESGRRVMVVNQTFADRFFPDEDPV
ncbi:MAG TPA: ABC transporter permease, partial [Thermoanaerobaculia bacterium]|nr:ABC transporter permease [Thermoanaerobaculia bacterium]